LNDGYALLLSFVYVAIVVGLAETLRRAGRVSFDISRKIIHVGIGTWILPTVLLFRSPWLAATPPAIFIVLNLASLARGWSRAMDEGAGENIGTVFFPLSFTLLIASLWNAEGGKAALTAGLLTMAWGDAAAALIGIRFGRHRYRVGRSWRSLEGSAAMFVFSVAAVAAAGALVNGGSYGPAPILAGAALATVLEAASRRGIDNLLVPVGTAFLLWGMGRIG